MSRKRVRSYLLSNPQKGLPTNVILTPSWKATLRKHLGNKNFSEELNDDLSWLADLITDINCPSADEKWRKKHKTKV